MIAARAEGTSAAHSVARPTTLPRAPHAPSAWSKDPDPDDDTERIVARVRGGLERGATALARSLALAEVLGVDEDEIKAAIHVCETLAERLVVDPDCGVDLPPIHERNNR